MNRRGPDEARTKLFEVAQQQAGHFTAKQALEAGYSSRLQHYHCNRGHWFRIDRGLYRLKEFPPGRHEDLVRWTLWSGGQAVVSHESAAAVHELGDILPSRVHITVPPGFRRRLPPGVIIHRDRLSNLETQEGEGFRVTTPLRTILDLLRSATESDWLLGAINAGIQRGAFRKAALESEIERLDLATQDRARRLLRQLEERPRAI